MPARSVLVFGFVYLSFGLELCARGDPPAARASQSPKEGPSSRTDLQGDPLPAGAIARLGTVRFRSSWNIDPHFLAFSPDGRTLACDGENEGVCLWDATTGERLRCFPKSFRVHAACLSADGKVLTAASYPGAILRWQVATGKLLQETRLPPDPDFLLRSIGFLSADGRTLGMTSPDGNGGMRVRLWDTATGQQVLQWEYQLKRYWTSAALSPDGKMLAVSGEGNLVLLIDAATGKEIHRVEGPNKYPNMRAGTRRSEAEAVRFLTFSRDSRIVASEARDSLCVWEVATGKLRQQIKASEGRMAFSPDGKYLACGDEEAVRLYEIASGKELRLEQPAGHYPFPAFSPDGKTLAARSRCTLRQWDVATGKLRHHIPGHDNPVVSLAFSPDSASLASGDEGDGGGGADGKVLVWDLATRKVRHVLPGHFPRVLSLAFSPDGKILASGNGGGGGGGGGMEAYIRLWDLGRGRLMREFFAHLNGVQSLAFSPDGKTLASTGSDARARLWDAASGERLRQLHVSDSEFKSVTFAPDGKTLLVAGTASGLSLWRADLGQKVRDLGGAGDQDRLILCAAFLPDGKSILAREFRSPNGPLGSINEFRLWDAGSGRLLRSLPMNDPNTSWSVNGLSSDGKTLATGGRDGGKSVIHLWDTDSGKRFARLPVQAEGARVLAFSPDGRYLASGGGDTTVLLWDLGRARLEHWWAELAAEGDSVRAVKRLAAKPEETVPFLKERLRRAAEMEGRASGLIADLDSDRFQVREKASRELEKLGPEAAFALRAALAGEASTEVRRRAQAVLDGMKRSGESSGEWDPRSVWLSLAVLEEIGTPAAQEILDELAKGPASSSVARRARAALEPLAKRPKSR